MSSYSGRVGTISDKVFADANQVADKYIQESYVLAWINECQDLVAAENYEGFRQWATCDLTDDQAYVDVLTKWSDIIDVCDVKYSSDGSTFYTVTPASSSTIHEHARVLGENDRPRYWHFDGKLLWIAPEPASSQSDKLYVLRQYKPTTLNGSTEDAPYTPAQFDQMYVYFCQYKIEQRKAQDQRPHQMEFFWSLYNRWFKRLTFPSTKGLHVVPYR